MFYLENVSVAKCEAVGSTIECASPRLPILLGGFGEAHSAAVPFGYFEWLILLES
jgi:hypothetical protein